MANPIMTSLPEYVEQRRLPLIGAAVLKGKSASLFNLQTDVKYKAAINLIGVNPTIQNGSECGWNDAGTATLSQRIITAPALKINQSFCEKEFLKYWTGYQVKVAAGAKTLPFEEDFVNEIIKNVQEKVEKLMWQGDTDSSDNELKLVDGMLKILGGENAVVKPTIASGASAYDAIKAVYLAIPEAVLDGAVIMVGADTFRQYAQELVEKNYFHYPVNGSAVEELFIPGTTCKVIALNGLNGTKKIVAGKLNNFFYGVDMMGDSEKIDLWYSKDNREFRLAVEFNMGVQVAYPDEVVMATLS